MTRRNVWRLILALSSLVVIAEKAAVTAHLIKSHPTFEGFALAIAGVVIFFESLASIIAGARATAHGAKVDDARKAVIACLRAMHLASSIDILAVGGSVYVADVRGLRRRPYLRRDVRFRISDMPQESDVSWISGKGAVGTAWLQKKLTHVNWSPIARKYGNAEISTQEFERIPAKTRSGFSHSEFQTIVAKYAEILAVPIFGKSGCVGVLAIDLPMQDYAGSGRLLDNPSIKEIASNCAGVLSNVFGHN